MIPLQSVAHWFASWEPLRPHLSEALLSAIEELRAYQSWHCPRVLLFASQPKVLADWREAASELPVDWEVDERVLPEVLDSSGSECFNELCCDAVVLLLPVLHMDPPAASSLADRLRPFRIPVYLVLLRFHQISRDAAVVRRKRQEAVQRFDLSGLRVLTCSDPSGPDLLCLADAAREIRVAVERESPAVRERHGGELAGMLNSRARNEISERQGLLRDQLTHLQAETAVARSAHRSVQALAKTVGEAFYRWSSGFIEAVGSLVWADIRQQVEDATAQAKHPEQWAEALRGALTERIAERWQQLAATRPFDLEKRLESLLKLARQSAERNAAALTKGPLGVFVSEVARVQYMAADEEAFRDLRQRCRELAQHWQPLASSEIDRVLRQECRGLDIALADLVGRKLPSLLPARGEGNRVRQPNPQSGGQPPGYLGLEVPANGPEEGPSNERSQVRQWVQDHTAGALRNQVGEAAVGSALASLHEMMAGALEAQRKALIEEELPEAIDRYFQTYLEAYDVLGEEIRGRLKGLAALLPRPS